MTINYAAIRELQDFCYENAKAKGFHDDRPTDPQALVWYQGNKITMMHSELSEAHDELRSGHSVTETYYPSKGSDLSLVALRDGIYKPEGVPSELADAVIRILDFCGAEDIDLASIIEEKLAYNASRAYLHGKKF